MGYTWKTLMILVDDDFSFGNITIRPDFTVDNDDPIYSFYGVDDDGISTQGSSSTENMTESKAKKEIIESLISQAKKTLDEMKQLRKTLKP
mgnify:CR=1 FL=1